MAHLGGANVALRRKTQRPGRFHRQFRLACHPQGEVPRGDKEAAREIFEAVTGGGEQLFQWLQSMLLSKKMIRPDREIGELRSANLYEAGKIIESSEREDTILRMVAKFSKARL